MRPSDINPLELSEKRPDWCAKVPLTPAQRLWLLILVALVIVAAVTHPFGTAKLFILVSSLFYLAITLYKFWIIGASVKKNAVFRFSPEEIASAHTATTSDSGLGASAAAGGWPVYSILVPMYKEPEVVPQMVRGLMAMDYPTDRLDVQLLLEEDDTATVAAARAASMPPNFRITLIPPSFPRTKPKACNIGLGLARGEYLVIYDAEDRPEPDQLKKAVLAFEAAGASVACVQSSLNFYNPRQNLLTRFFTGDYSAWFDLQLPGLSARRAVIPLGGTSNHFRTSVLRDLLGWDAYNVTEDCDLGVRLCRAGYTTAMLDTTTWEEACSSVPFWIRQRTRWIKGYLQTWFVHMRNPFRLLRELGPRNFLHFQALVGGVCLSFLLNPIFWVLALVWFLVHPTGLDRLFPGPVFAIGAFCLFAGNFLFVYTILLGCYRRKQDRLLLSNLLAPLYWVLMSIAGWRAFFQFFRNPFLWEKTRHALGKTKGAPMGAPPPAAAKSGAQREDGQAALGQSGVGAPPPAAEGGGSAAPSVRPAACGGGAAARTVAALAALALVALAVLAALRWGNVQAADILRAVRAEVANGTTCGRQALVGSPWWGPLPMLVAALLPARFAPFAAVLPPALCALSLLSGLAWLFRGRMGALIALAFSLAMALLCGIPAWGFAAVGTVLLILGTFVHRIRRLPGTFLLGILPSVYVFLVWLLLDALILQDTTVFLRPAATLTRGDVPILFQAPVPDERAKTPDDLLPRVLAAARERSPYARVFICGYEGLGEIDRAGDKLSATDREAITPVLDLHLSELRKAYHGQVHFLLVKDPRGDGRFESHSIRLPNLYEFGADGTILAADFGPWRLYELVSLEGL